MARTLVGELLFRFRDDASRGARKAAQNIESDLARIQRSAKSFTNLHWGASFQKQLDHLKLSPSEFKAVEAGWASLNNKLNNQNLGKALRKSEIAVWKSRTVGHFADVRKAIDDTERRAKRMQRALSDSILRPLMVMGGGYTGTYMAGVAGREGLIAASSRLREQTRQRMASIPVNEQTTIESRARDLSTEFGSVNITDIMEMARVARNTMGNTERGMQILDQMVSALVTLQTMKGVDAATTEINGLVKALDNLGQNSGGEVGVKNVNQIIEAFVRASQIEGEELDLGRTFQFARRSKIAGPGLSADFFNIAPALMQDMAPETFGAALSSAYQSLVIGANSVASKQNLQNQRDLGIRVGPGKGQLLGDQLFATNPYQWVKDVLMPKLVESGVDMGNDAEVSKKIASLARNTNTTGLLTRMVQQSEQIDRLGELYGGAQGTGMAKDLRNLDPFVGWKAFKSAFSNLSAAVGEDTLPTITSGLNSLADTLNSLAATIQDDPLLGYSALGIGGGAAVYGGVKAFKGLTALATAGPALQKSAVDLTAAARALQGAAATDGASGGGKKGSWWKNAVGWSIPTLLASIIAGDVIEDFSEGGQKRSDARKVSANKNWAQNANTGMGNTAGPLGILGGGLNTSQAENDAKAGGKRIEESLSPTGKPSVDTSSIQEAINLADQLAAKLNAANAAGTTASRNLKRQIGSSHTDFGGVSP